MVRIDMSEYSEAHSVSRLLGSPFGYKGFDEGSPILNEIAEKPFCVLLLDEIEKAHPDVHRLFLQVFDRGVLTDTQRRHIFFSDVIIIMTSNVMVKHTDSIGYHSHSSEVDVRQQLTRHFAPEFLNRIDFIGLFNSLSKETSLQIVENKIIPVLKKIWIEKDVRLRFTNEAKNGIAEKGCTEIWGARNLERTVDELINSPLTKFLPVLDEKELNVLVKYENDVFEFEKLSHIVL
jgi:ATP-dependent Clp protease ATP-binding subunit ClpA